MKLNTILLVDDNPADNYIHRRILLRADCAEHIEVSLNGAEGVAYISQRIEQHQALPELIFLDINMPVLDGWGFLEEFRALPMGTADAPIVVMLTTSLHPRDVARARKSGMVAEYIDKPLTVETLETLLQRLFVDASRPG